MRWKLCSVAILIASMQCGATTLINIWNDDYCEVMSLAFRIMERANTPLLSAKEMVPFTMPASKWSQWMRIVDASKLRVLQAHLGLATTPVIFSCFNGGDWYPEVGTCHSCCGNGTIWEWYIQCATSDRLSTSSSASTEAPPTSQQTAPELTGGFSILVTQPGGFSAAPATASGISVTPMLNNTPSSTFQYIRTANAEDFKPIRFYNDK